MKKQILAIAMLATGLSASAQELEKTAEITKTVQLSYNVAPDGKTKEGLYSLKNLSNKGLWLRGSYANNARSGTWYFFDSKENLAMRYSYDQKKVLFLDPKSLSNVAVKVLSDDEEVAKTASAPIPLCPVELYVSLIGNKVATEYYDKANEGLVAEITAHIDVNGKATYSVAYQIKDKKTRPIEVAFTPSFPIEWLPSKLGDKKLPSEFTVFAKVDEAKDEYNFNRFRWDQE
ncbi:hypothetical protein [Mucilaginibacter myungsuensis]|uniref:Outer membrane lipoprotein-sorting protein n=1 Tax=Mucilaginibacter myungsuensis TaxID=649104 RepID=A0A929PVU2_9SPHI|nr:hypothetical protein [Mucilaginibacter myungsuensis]MBE9661386.1 hypothetical protein [Mucilaginibacter myungsuensis]MDN3597529.1 hypothetical protein [Mucilaginibacter myungsuensis]